MNEAEILVANLPSLQEQRQALGVWWNSSHHSQNFRDAKEKVKEVWGSSSMLTKILTVPFGVGLGTGELVELSWVNENEIADRALTHYANSGGELTEAFKGAAEFTGSLEMGLGVGGMVALHMYRPAMDVIRQRYFSKEIADNQQDALEKTSELQNSKVIEWLGKPVKAVAKAGKIWGLAMSTGAMGVTLIEDASRTEYSATKNAATAVSAAGMLALTNGSIAYGVLWAVETETPYVSDGLMNIAELFKTPGFVIGILGTGLAVKTVKERRRIIKKWAEEAQQTSLGGESMSADQLSKS